MKILLVAATSFEIAPFIDYLEKNHQKESFFEFKIGESSIYILVTGVGAMHTSFAMARLKNIEEFDIAINVGLAGAFDLATPLGEVFEVYKDRFADIGVQEANGEFTDVFELNLANENQFPFTDGSIISSHKYETRLDKKSSITVNKVHGEKNAIQKIMNKYNPDLESMEGAGFFYASKIIDLPCIQIRAISNHIIPREKDKWEIELAIKNLNHYLQQFMLHLIETSIGK